MARLPSHSAPSPAYLHPNSHVLPHLDAFISLALACMEVPVLTESNMPSANNAIWSLGEIIIKV